jgi:hypothetical protein
MYQWDKNIDFPSVITIFSAPNYCDMEIKLLLFKSLII